MSTREYSNLERRLLNNFQRGLPLIPTPFADMAEALGVGEAEVIAGLRRLQDSGAVSRVGPVLRPNRVGTSTLAAMAVPPELLELVGALVSTYREVNHNYEREHRLNLWFVVTADDRDKIEQVLAEIEARTGIPVMDLPMLEDYFIDLGFELQWT
jgi:DNA-binding Lrp family transcriptional regulator